MPPCPDSRNRLGVSGPSIRGVSPTTLTTTVGWIAGVLISPIRTSLLQRSDEGYYPEDLILRQAIAETLHRTGRATVDEARTPWSTLSVV
jgi:hypothetical protein